MLSVPVLALLYGPAAFRKRDCAWKAEVADMYPASHDDSTVNGFLPTAIGGQRQQLGFGSH
jgi:hypothetical protein